MKKSAMISIQPYWVFLIIAHKMGWNIPQRKTVDVRKDYPKSPEWDKKTFIYCSKDKKSFKRIPKEYQPLMEPLLGKVVGEFTCAEIYRYVPILFKGQDFYQGYMDEEYQACISHSELCKYAKGKTVYGWRISELKVYDQPKELSDFDLAYCKVSMDIACDECPYYDWNSILHSCRKRRLTRPPQSWCYIEEI